MRFTRLFALSLVSMMAASCDPGSLRMLDDSLSEANGYEVVYYDQSNVDYIAEVRNTYGVSDGEGFYEYDNEGGDYYKLRIWFEDGGVEYVYLEPYETTGRMWMSIYNQVDSTEAIYGSYRGIFDESLDE